VDPFGLDAAGTLAFVVDRRRRQDLAAAEELRGVCQWADLHRTSGVGAIAPDVEKHIAQRGPFVLDTVLGLEGELRLAGEGAFTVEEFAITQLAAALGMPETTARHYVGQGLELRDRLPRLWGQVMAGLLPAWKARKIAEETIPLNAAAAAHVDAHLAPFAHKLSFGRVMAAVEAAILRHDPDLAAERATKAAVKHGVWIDDRIDGTSEIHAITDTPDAVAFDTALNDAAGALAALGDTDPDQVRRAKAIGVLADPQYALDLQTTAQAGAGIEERAKRASRNHVGGGASPTFHIHLHTDAVEAGSGVARVEGYGPRALETIRRWLTGLGADATVKLTPVVDLTEHISVDAYEVPDRLRTQTEHRDHSCRFPWCGRRGSFDVDHIDPYVARDDGGPPGQTNSSNLARLCRFHHRVKTHGDWDYQRDPDGTLTWTSPLGRTYTVDDHGTRPHSRTS
jgi:hypothetical protein